MSSPVISSKAIGNKSKKWKMMIASALTFYAVSIFWFPTSNKEQEMDKLLTGTKTPFWSNTCLRNEFLFNKPYD